MQNVTNLDVPFEQRSSNQLVAMALFEICLTAHKSNTRRATKLDQALDARKVRLSLGHGIIVRFAFGKIILLTLWPSADHIAHEDVFDVGSNERALQRFTIEMGRVAAEGLTARINELLDIVKLEQFEEGFNFRVAMADAV